VGHHLKEADMSQRPGRRLTEAERDERRKGQREKLEQACRELLTSEGWQRWVRVRATNGLGGRYSFHNQCLLASQARARGVELRYVTGFRSFLTLGRAVRKGEKALWILAPMLVKQPEDQDGGGEPAGEEPRRIFFRAVPVFDVSQTGEIPGAEVVPLSPPSQPIDGDSHARLIGPLQQHAGTLDYRVEHRALTPGGPEGWCDHERKLIVIGAGPANRKVRILVHELAHAHGITYTGYSRHQAEVLVDTITHIVLSQAGLDVGGETLPYIAGWGETGALDSIAQYAQTIDTIARQLEAVVIGDDPAGEQAVGQAEAA
jgi:hypothetical protein